MQRRGRRTWNPGRVLPFRVTRTETDLPSGATTVGPKVPHLPPAVHGHGQVLHVEYVGLHLTKGNWADLIHVEGGDLVPTSLIFDF